MKFSTKAEYGLRAMVSLANNYQEQSYSLGRIAKEENISLAYLERLMAKLKKANLITSTKGASGGYRLNKKPEQIKVSEIIEILENTISPFSCLDNKTCQKKNCGAKKVWQKLDTAIRSTLNNITLKDLI